MFCRIPDKMIDIGFGIYENAKVLKLALIVFDVLFNYSEKSIVIGFGIPYVRAYCFMYSLDAERMEKFNELGEQSKLYWRLHGKK